MMLDYYPCVIAHLIIMKLTISVLNVNQVAWPATKLNV